MSTGTFEKQLEKITVKFEENMLLALKNAIRNVIFQAQMPINEGGKMPVDTGFLRWSGVASLNEIPSGLVRGRERKPGEKGVLPEYKMGNEGGKMVNTCLINMKLGDTFYFGWTANYAKYQEMYHGFLISAVDNFKFYFNNELRRLK